MFAIRSDHVDALDEFTLFTQRMLLHARRFFPRVCERLGPELTRRTVVECLQRGRRHGFTTRRSLSKYLNLAFVYGPRFDVDPRYPWAGAILGNPALRGQAERLEQLYAAARRQLQRECERATSR